MSTKEPGRNDLCPCGSLRKYKRCCLPVQLTKEQMEVLRRQRAWADCGGLEADYRQAMAGGISVAAQVEELFLRSQAMGKSFTASKP